MSFNKKQWVALASSEQESEKLEALDSAKVYAAQLQEELMYWFACNTAARWRFKIYELLDDMHQEKALELISDKGNLTGFDRIKSFEQFAQAKELEMQQAIVHLERWFMKPSEGFKNSLYLQFKNQKKCSLDESKLAVNRLFVEEPGQVGDEIAGDSRSDE